MIPTSHATLAPDAASCRQNPVGTVAVVTGATGDIGRWIVDGLASAGCHVVAVGRSEAKLSALAAWIGSRHPRALVEPALADLSSLAETTRLADGLLRRHRAIGLLVNNAGMFPARRTLTAEGRERVLAVNHLSPFLLTRALLPALEVASSGGPASRVVQVGSSSSDRARLDPDDLELRRGWGIVRSYARSKLALMLAAFALAERLDRRRVTVNVVHPGGVRTGIVRSGGIVQLGWLALQPFLLTAEQGAATPLRLALSDDLAGQTGRYLKPSGWARPNPRALDLPLRARLVEATERLVGS